MNLPPITLQLFAFFQWTVSISYFCSQYKEISRLSNDGKIQASVCISNPVCSLHVVLSLHFKPSLHFILTDFDRQMIPFFFRFSLKLRSFLSLFSVCPDSRLCAVGVLMKQLLYSGLLDMK